MTGFADLGRWIGKDSTLPPLTSIVAITLTESEPGEVLEGPSADLQPISAFVCIIEYEGNTRLITCRRFDRIGEANYIGAICHSAKGYRQFRCDRVQSVFDATTGETLGDGSYFDRFATDSNRERAPSWSLSPSRKATLVAGLNILAFMARCDGLWHPLETDVVESFICSMWLRKEWEGDPPIEEILTHAQRLAPDSDTFFRSLEHYAHSSISTKILCRAVGQLIEADGVICGSETQWGAEIDAFFRGYSEEEFRKHFGNQEASMHVALSPKMPF